MLKYINLKNLSLSLKKKGLNAVLSPYFEWFGILPYKKAFKVQIQQFTSLHSKPNKFQHIIILEPEKALKKTKQIKIKHASQEYHYLYSVPVESCRTKIIRFKSL
jgi:hypothetical protein